MAQILHLLSSPFRHTHCQTTHPEANVYPNEPEDHPIVTQRVQSYPIGVAPYHWGVLVSQNWIARFVRKIFDVAPHVFCGRGALFSWGVGGNRGHC